MNVEIESEIYEEKSQATWSTDQDFKIIKTIIAFANTDGGRIEIKNAACDKKTFDSARLDDAVNKWVLPRVANISSVIDGERVLISVAASTNAPHVITKEANFLDTNGKNKSAFYPGQILVRHSSKTEPATGDDLQKIVAKRVREVLSAVADSISSFGIKISDEDNAIPLKISGQEGLLELDFADVNKTYVHTATSLGAAIGKNQSFAVAATKDLGLKGDPKYHFALGGHKYPVNRYSKECELRILEELNSDDKYWPY